MSHKASHWLADISPALLKDSDFRVMFHLCDAHNSKRSADTACFPSQETLREATGLSNGGLNNALNRLEQAGLMRRRRTRNADGTKGPTYYILGCDVSDIQPSPESGDGAKPEHSSDIDPDSVVDKPVDNSATISTLGAEPSPHRGSNQLHARGDKPVKEPVKEPCARVDGRERLEARAEIIKRHRPFLCSSMSAQAARECLDLGLVTENDCRLAGIAI